jgi:tetratricopeptide (TPR) repeat protein
MSTYDDMKDHGGPGAIRDLELVEELRETPDSVIYRARREGSEYTVRVARERHAPDSETLQKFRRDAAIHASLAHPLIPTSYEVGLHEGRAFVVSEAVSGETLEERCVGEPLDESMAVVIAGAVAGALAEIHEQGLVHGHIDQGRVVLTDGGEIKLVDFGLGGERTEPAGRVGRSVDMRYAAPERVGDLERPVDGRADLYALGAVLFESVGEPAKGGLEQGGELASLTHVAPRVSPAFGAVVEKLLEVEPDDRYQSARELKADLGRLDELNDRHAAGSPMGLGGIGPTERDDQERPFVGRERELAMFEKLWDGLQEGDGHVAVVEGRAGTGKSWLMEEVCREVVGDETRILRGGCEETSPVPFVPLRQGLERYAGQFEGGGRAGGREATDMLAEAAAPFGGLLSTVSPAIAEIVRKDKAVVGRDAHEVFYNAFASLFTDLSDRLGGLVLWIDDAHWMGEATLDVLRILGDQLADHPLLLVVTSRNGPSDAPALEHLVGEIGAPSESRIELAAFDADDASRLIGVELGQSDPQGPLVDELTRRSRGNPFLLHQQIRLLRDQGVLAPSWDSWTVDREQLRDVRRYREPGDWVVHRMETMPPEVGQVLSVASALGHGFSVEQLQFVCRDHEQAAVHRAIQIGLEAEFLARKSEGPAYVFAHDRIRELFFGRLDGDDRIPSIRRRAAEYLDEVDDPTVRQIYERARHYLAGDDRATDQAVVEALWVAGQRAVEEFAFEDAYGFFRAIDGRGASERVDDRGQFWELFGEASFRTDRLEEAVEAFERATEEAEEPVRRAKLRAEIAQAKVHALDERGAREEATRAFDELGMRVPTSRWSFAPLVYLQILGHWLVTMLLVWTGIGKGSVSGRQKTRCEALVDLFDVGFHVGYYSRNKPYVLQSGVYGLRPAHYLGASREYSLGFVIYAATLAMAGFTGAARRYGRRALENAERVADRQTLAFTRQTYGVVKSVCGDVDDAVALERELLESAPDWLDSATYNLVCVDLTESLMVRGRAREGYEVTRAGLRRMERNGGPLWRIYRMRSQASLMAFAAMLGREEEAARLRERVFELGEEIASDRALPWVSTWGFEAIYLAQTGPYGDDLDRAITGHEEFGIAPSDAVHQSKHFFVGQAYALLGRAEHAGEEELESRLDDLEEAVEALETTAHYESLACHALAAEGGLKRLAGDWQEAGELLDEAVERSRADGNVWSELEALRQRALLLDDRRREGKAREAAREACRVAREAGWSHRVASLRDRFDLEVDGGEGVEQESSDESEPVVLGPEREPEGLGAEAPEKLSALASMTLSAGSDLSPEGRIQEVLDTFVGQVEATRGFLCRWNREVGESEFIDGRDRSGFDVEAPAAPASEEIAEVFEGGAPIRTGRTGDQAADGPENACVLALPPLAIGGDPSMAVYLENLDGTAILEADRVDEVMMLGVAATGLLRIDQGRSGWSGADAERRARRMVQVSQRLERLRGRTGDPASQLRAFLRECRREIPCAVSSAAWLEESVGGPIEVGEATDPAAGDVLTRWRGHVPTGESGRERFVERRDGSVALCVPLYEGDILHGVAILQRHGGGEFSEFEVELGLMFGDLVHR